jgi:Fe-S cluster biogenesis protein NfuA
MLVEAPSIGSCHGCTMVPRTEDHGDENGIELPVPGGVSVESVGAESSDSNDSHDRLKVADGELS